MEFNGKNARLVFTIKSVESIPCDLRGQVVAFDADNELISDPVRTKWPMPWVTEELQKLARGDNEMPDDDRFRVYNPEEPDQYVYVEAQIIC